MTITNTNFFDNILTVNKICKGVHDQNSVIVCIHNEVDEILILYEKIKIKKSFWVKERQVNFCPFCGFSYQPERSKREDSITNKTIIGNL